MQEIHTIGGGMLFSGLDRRMRPFQNNQHHQALKCPRCNSFNTKFCYYNNYNLSQPRHFCKNCRRYWTKGGVLRNVPVGGGSRKSKRSNKSTSSTNSETAPATTPTPQPQPPESKSNSNSSSQSSTLTSAVTDAISTPKSIAASNVFTVNPALEPEQVGGILSETTGSFMSQGTSNNETFSFGFGNHVLDASSFRYRSTHQQQHGNDQVHVAQSGGSLVQRHWQQQKGDHRYEEFTTPSLLDHAAVSLEFSSPQNKSVGGGFGSLDWHTGADQSLFDLPNTVNHPYWTYPHWSDHVNSTLSHLP